MFDGIRDKLVYQQNQRTCQFWTDTIISHRYLQLDAFGQQLAKVGFNAREQRFQADEILPAQFMQFCMKRR